MITITVLYRKSSNKTGDLFRKNLFGVGAYSRGAYSREGDYSPITKNITRTMVSVLGEPEKSFHF